MRRLQRRPTTGRHAERTRRVSDVVAPRQRPQPCCDTPCCFYNAAVALVVQETVHTALAAGPRRSRQWLRNVIQQHTGVEAVDTKLGLRYASRTECECALSQGGAATQWELCASHVGAMCNKGGHRLGFLVAQPVAAKLRRVGHTPRTRLRRLPSRVYTLFPTRDACAHTGTAWPTNRSICAGSPLRRERAACCRSARCLCSFDSCFSFFSCWRAAT